MVEVPEVLSERFFVTAVTGFRRVEKREYFKFSDGIAVDRDGGSDIVVKVLDGDRYYFAVVKYKGGPDNDPNSYVFDCATFRSARRASSLQKEVGRAVVDSVLCRMRTDLDEIICAYLSR